MGHIGQGNGCIHVYIVNVRSPLVDPLVVHSLVHRVASSGLWVLANTLVGVVGVNMVKLPSGVPLGA